MLSPLQISVDNLQKKAEANILLLTMLSAFYDDPSGILLLLHSIYLPVSDRAASYSKAMGTSWLIYRWPPYPAPISICILWSFSRSTWISAAPAGGQKAQHWPVWQGSEHQLQLFCIPVLQRILISKWHCNLKYAQHKTGTSAEGFNEKHRSLAECCFSKQLNQHHCIHKTALP